MKLSSAHVLTILLLSFTTVAIAGNSTAPATASSPATTNATAAAVANAYTSSPQMPVGIRRIVVLPLACDEGSGTLSDGCQMLDPVLRAALIQTGEFEVVPASAEILSRCTGRSNWTGAEELPPDFFGSMKRLYGCGAVLFCQLTVFRPNPPLAVGWRLKLADCQTGKILWATDEIYDAANLTVAKSAKLYEKHQQPRQGIIYDAYTFVAWCLNTPTRSALDDQWNILHSPRYFGRFAAEQVLQTMPPR